MAAGSDYVTIQWWVAEKKRFPTSGNDKKPLSSFPVVIPACPESFFRDI